MIRNPKVKSKGEHVMGCRWVEDKYDEEEKDVKIFIGNQRERKKV